MISSHEMKESSKSNDAIQRIATLLKSYVDLTNIFQKEFLGKEGGAYFENTDSTLIFGNSPFITKISGRFDSFKIIDSQTSTKINFNKDKIANLSDTRFHDLTSKLEKMIREMIQANNGLKICVDESKKICNTYAKSKYFKLHSEGVSVSSLTESLVISFNEKDERDLFEHTYNMMRADLSHKNTTAFIANINKDTFAQFWKESSENTLIEYKKPDSRSLSDGTFKIKFEMTDKCKHKHIYDLLNDHSIRKLYNRMDQIFQGTEFDDADNYPQLVNLKAVFNNATHHVELKKEEKSDKDSKKMRSNPESKKSVKTVLDQEAALKEIVMSANLTLKNHDNYVISNQNEQQRAFVKSILTAIASGLMNIHMNNYLKEAIYGELMDATERLFKNKISLFNFRSGR